MPHHHIHAIAGLGCMLVAAACAIGGPGEDTLREPPATSERPEPPGGVLGTPIAIVPHDIIDAESGAMCLYPNGRFANPLALPEVVSVEAGERLRARIPYDGCLSSSCDINRVAECDFRWDGDVLRLTSHLAFDAIEGQACTMDCLQLVAECESEPMPEGEIRLRFGDHERRLIVPSHTEACEPVTCERDADCAEMCGYDSQGHRMCQPWAQLGEACEGFMPAELVRRCAPGLACIKNGKTLDLPGSCLQVCKTDTDCDDGVCTYVGADDKVCLAPY